MKTNKILLLGGILALFSACNKYLDPYLNGDYSTDEIWKYQNRVHGLVGSCYDNMPWNYDNNEGVFLDVATVDDVSTDPGRNTRRMAVGSLTSGNDPFLTYWDRDYRSIRQVNLFLKDRRGFNTKYLIHANVDSVVRYRLQGEAFGLRAWFYWDLLQRFGGKGINSGKLLGVPIILEPIVIGEVTNTARNTYDQCVNQIIADCDSAIKYLPIAHRDFLVTNPSFLNYAGGRYWGRLDGITMKAIKSNVYLTWASPLFNSSNDNTRWEKAAQYAKEVMDFKINVDGPRTGGFKKDNAVNWLDPNSGEIVFSARYSSGNDVIERLFYPGGFQGYGAIGATQELVDAFPMMNGYPISVPRSLYNAKAPYANRDPRFYSNIFYNTSQAKRITTNAVMYTFENWANGGKDAVGVVPTNSLTNYHIKKYVYMGLNWADASINRQTHTKMFIRWTHMVLNFSKLPIRWLGQRMPQNSAFRQKRLCRICAPEKPMTVQHFILHPLIFT